MGIRYLDQVGITRDEVISGRTTGQRYEVVVVGITSKSCLRRLIGVALGEVCEQGNENVYLIVGEVPSEPGSVKHPTQLVEQHG